MKKIMVRECQAIVYYFTLGHDDTIQTLALFIIENIHCIIVSVHARSVVEHEECEGVLLFSVCCMSAEGRGEG